MSLALDDSPGTSAAPPSALDAVVDSASEALLKLQQPDGHWVFELEADATIPAEYVLFKHYLGEPEDLELERKIGVYLRRIQGAHGGWPLFHGGAFDISASVKAYFALKMIGDDTSALHMVRAREAILANGGAAATNVFTRIQLALYAAAPWSAIPIMPVELILVPRWFPIRLSKMSYWARTVIVPLLVLQVKKPLARNARGTRIDELYHATVHIKPKSKAADTKLAWTVGFNILDVALKAVEGLWPKGLRQMAIDRCTAFVTERLNGLDGLGAIYPAMANSVMMFEALGYREDHPDRAVAREAVARLVVVHEDEAYCQPCVSPVWDTALTAHALMEAGGEAGNREALRALEWLKPRQVLDVRGDWAEQRPNVRPGGWAFQYNNPHYPDTDDTAVVVMALDRGRALLDAGAGYDEAIARGKEWIVGLQCRNGGWGAFDADNEFYYLNNIPFADHGALLDPPTVDVAARCVSMLAQLGEAKDSPRLARALAYLEREQTPDGSWFGRWGVNYIYGAWSALCALNAAGVDSQAPVVRKAVDWLVKIQNADGGWGEDCESYALDYKGYQPCRSIASQTAWALIGLMAAGEVDNPAVARGIQYLIDTQAPDGLWGQEHYTGGGFPRVFYLRYHGYPKIFPLWAVARYRNLKRTNDPHVAFGM
jgi:squalene-hopene/tetraprenyl-beta-curcumene cyclase